MRNKINKKKYLIKKRKTKNYDLCNLHLYWCFKRVCGWSHIISIIFVCHVFHKSCCCFHCLHAVLEYYLIEWVSEWVAVSEEEILHNESEIYFEAQTTGRKDIKHYEESEIRVIYWWQQTMCLTIRNNRMLGFECKKEVIIRHEKLKSH